MNTLIKKSMLILALSTVLSGMSVQTPAEEPNIKLHYSDLDLSKTKNVTILYGRITRAATMICRDSSAPWDGSKQSTFRRCYKATVDAAVKDFNHYGLTAIHEETDELLANR